MKNKALYLLLAALAVTACTGIWLKVHGDGPVAGPAPDPW